MTHEERTQLNNERILLNAVLSTMDKGIIEYKVKGKDGFKIVMPAKNLQFYCGYLKNRVKNLEEELREL